jgi:hypothetical protein
MEPMTPRRGEAIERRLRALVRQRAVVDSAALVAFSVAMAWALLLLVVGLFWSGWVMALLAIPVAVLAVHAARENRFWKVAGLVEERFPEVRGRLVAAVQLSRWGTRNWGQGSGVRGQGSGVREGYSEEMIDAAVRDAERAFVPLALGRLVNWRRFLWACVALGLIAVCFGVVVRTAPQRVEVGITNAFSRRGAEVRFQVQPGDTEVMPNSMVALRVRVSPAGVFHAVRLDAREEGGGRREEGGVRYETRVVRLDRDTGRVELAAGTGFDYRFRVLARYSDTHSVGVIEPMALERLTFTCHYPDYTGLPEAKVPGPELSALKGTVVDMEAQASRPVGRGRLVLGLDTFPLAVDAHDPARVTGRFVVKQDAEGSVELAERAGTGGPKSEARGQKLEARSEDVEGGGPKSEARGQKLEARSEDAEGGGPKSEARGQKLEARSEDAEGGGPKSEARGQKLEARSEDAEGGGPKSEARGQKLEARSEDVEGGGPKSEARGQKLEARSEDVEGGGPKSEARGQKLEARSEAADGGREEMQKAGVVRVRAVTDETPFVKLFLPGRDVDLPVSMKVLLGVNSLDDFGLGELWLHFGKDSTGTAMRLKSLGGRREDTTFYQWDLSDAGLLPGEALHYCVTASDNDRVSGPKTGQSDVFTVRFPTMTEIYNASVQQTERTASELGPMQSEQAQLGEEMNRAADELKKSRELSWDERQAVQKALTGQEGLMQQVSDLKQQVEQMKQELSGGMTLDQETMDRMGQLQQLLSELLPRELQQSLSQLRQKLEQQSPDVQRALDKFQMDQGKMKEGIDRALELLKKIMEEQRLEALARKADELAKTEQKLTDELGKQPSDKSAQLQQDVKEAVDSLKKEMQSLADSMSDKEVGDSLAKLAQQAEKDQLSEQAQQLAGQMQQGQTGQAKSGGEKLSQQLENLSKQLSSLSSQLKKKRSEDIARKLGGTAADLLMLSEQQEKLERVGPGMPDLSTQAASQMALHDAAQIAAESLASLASQSMSVPPQLGQELAQAMNSMEQAAQAMSDNSGYQAQQGMAQARVSLNSTVEALLQAMADAQQGGGLSSGMEGLVEALSKMAGEQMSINAGMDGFPIPMPGGLSPEQAAALGQLAAREQALREQLEGMLGSLGGTQPGLTGSLQGLVDDMKQVEKDLSELNVNRTLVERQENILAHLLDTQRSVRQQGFKDERQSESGKEFDVLTRPNLPEDKGERNRMLR